MRESLNSKPEKEDTEFDAETVRIELSKMSKKAKFAKLDSLVLDNYIIALSIGKISPIELAPIVTYLKNNKVVQDAKEEESEADVIDGLIDEVIPK